MAEQKAALPRYVFNVEEHVGHDQPLTAAWEFTLLGPRHVKVKSSGPDYTPLNLEVTEEEVKRHAPGGNYKREDFTTEEEWKLKDWLGCKISVDDNVGTGDIESIEDIIISLYLRGKLIDMSFHRDELIPQTYFMSDGHVRIEPWMEKSQRQRRREKKERAARAIGNQA